MGRLDESQRMVFLENSTGWELRAESISKTYVLADFNEALGFVVRLGILAEQADHHPDIDIRWNTVTITLSTHSARALTEQDTDLALAIDGLLTNRVKT